MCLLNAGEEQLDVTDFALPNQDFGVDQIFQVQEKRVTKALDTIKPDLMKAGMKLFTKSSQANL